MKNLKSLLENAKKEEKKAKEKAEAIKQAEGETSKHIKEYNKYLRWLDIADGLGTLVYRGYNIEKALKGAK